MSVQPPHPNTAIAQLQAQSSPLGQPLLIQCAKVKFVSPHFQYSDGYLGTTSLSLCNKMFAFVNVIVDFIVTAIEDFLRLGRMKSTMFIMTYVYSGHCKGVLGGHFVCAVFYF